MVREVTVLESGRYVWQVNDDADLFVPGTWFESLMKWTDDAEKKKLARAEAEERAAQAALIAELLEGVAYP
jgi:hypothetical protein